MSLLPGIPISDEQCIGDSLPILNSSFLRLSSSTYMLSGQIDLTNYNLGLTAINLTNRLNLTAAALTNQLNLTAASLTNRINLTAASLTSHLNLTAVTLTDRIALTASTLSNQISLTAASLTSHLNLTAANLTTLTRLVSTLPEATILTDSSTFVLSSVHNKHIVFLNSNASIPTSVTKAKEPFRAGHRTTFVQTGSATVNLYGFNGINGSAAIAGQYGVVEARYADRATLPLSGWVVDGDLAQMTEPFPFALSAAPAPDGAEDVINQITLYGERPDVIYYYADPESNIDFIPMNIYVNGYYRTQCDFTKERGGTLFGYRPANFNTGTFGPVATGSFVSTAGENVYLFVDGFNAEPTYISLSATTVGDEVFDEPNQVSYYSATIAGNGSTVFYLADPDLDVVGSETAGSIRISTDNGATYGPAVGVFTFRQDRAGQLFGFKRPGVVGGPEATIQLPTAGPTVDLLFKLPVDNRPTPTAPPPTPSATAPTVTPTPTITPPLPTTLVSLNAAPAPGNEDVIHNIAFTLEPLNQPMVVGWTETYTISYAPRTLEDLEMESPMILYVNGQRIGIVEFPNDFTGTQFRLQRRAGVVRPPAPDNNLPVTTGWSTFRPGRVDVVLVGDVVPPTPTPEPTPNPPPGPLQFSIQALSSGAEDVFNQIEFTALNNNFRDTISYSAIVQDNYTLASPMTIALSGVYRTTISFPQDRLGTQFFYRLAGILDNGVPGNGVLTFATGLSDLSAAGTGFGFPRLSALSAVTTTAEDPANQISITSTNGAYNNDAIYYYHSQDPDYELAPPMTVRYNNINRAVVLFPQERLGTPFGYAPAGSVGPQSFTLFRSGTAILP